MYLAAPSVSQTADAGGSFCEYIWASWLHFVQTRNSFIDPRNRPSRDRPTSAVGPHAVGMSQNQIATLAPLG